MLKCRNSTKVLIPKIKLCFMCLKPMFMSAFPRKSYVRNLLKIAMEHCFLARQSKLIPVSSHFITFFETRYFTTCRIVKKTRAHRYLDSTSRRSCVSSYLLFCFVKTGKWPTGKQKRYSVCMNDYVFTKSDKRFINLSYLFYQKTFTASIKICTLFHRG